MSTDDVDVDAEPTGYAAAQRELDRIVAELEADTVDVDVLAAKVRRASLLIRWCRSRIGGARMEVESVVADLERLADGGPPALSAGRVKRRHDLAEVEVLHLELDLIADRRLDLRSEPPPSPPEGSPPRRSTHRWSRLGALAAATSLVVAVATGGDDSSSSAPDPATPETATTHPAIAARSSPAGPHLLATPALGGRSGLEVVTVEGNTVVAIDLDTGASGEVPGVRPVGDDATVAVVPSGIVVVTPLGTELVAPDGTVRPLGSGFSPVLSADGSTLWAHESGSSPIEGSGPALALVGHDLVGTSPPRRIDPAPGWLVGVTPAGPLIDVPGSGVYAIGETGDPTRVALGELVAADARRVATRRCDEQLVCRLVVVDGTDGGELASIELHLVPSTTRGRFSPDGRWLALATLPDEGTGAPTLVLDLATGHATTALGEVPGVSALGQDLAWSPDSRWLLVVDAQGQLHAFDTATDRPRADILPGRPLAGLGVRAVAPT